MNPIDYRNATWESIQGHLTLDRDRVRRAWQAYGPGTTREISQRSGIDLLTFRPRTTDLVQLGFVECTGNEGREGVYRARTWGEARAHFDAQKRQLTESAQLSLKI